MLNSLNAYICINGTRKKYLRTKHPVQKYPKLKKLKIAAAGLKR